MGGIVIDRPWEDPPAPTDGRGGRCARFAAAFALATGWAVFSIWVSQPWIADLGDLTHPLIALFVLTFIAYVPGFMNAFLLGSLVLEPRYKRRQPRVYPAVSVLIAAYNEAQVIAETLRSVSDVGYPGKLEVIVVDDGSSDGTAAVVGACDGLFGGQPDRVLRLLRQEENGGKARALNSGLQAAANEMIVTIDADTRLEPGSVTAIVERFLAAPADTVAIAGTVLVGNARDSLLTGAQEWDYFHGIAAVKRMQSMFGGTLVAQGAFSILRRSAVVAAGGWPDTVGEDIVLTWALLKEGHRIGYADDAIAWTQAPIGLSELARQRKRWARGMIEALEHHQKLLFQARLRTMFIWWNLLFVSLDLAFTLAFLPGLLLALLGVFWLAGPITLLVLPLAALWNMVIYRIQTRMLKRTGVTMKRNRVGFLLYAFIYPLLLQPIAAWGYIAELTGRTKQWGRK